MLTGISVIKLMTTSITTEAKLRIIYRLVRAAADIVPCIKEGKVVVEAMVDCVDEYRKGIVYSVAKSEELTTRDEPQRNNPVADRSLIFLWREMGFDHISFPPNRFSSILGESVTIELEDCVIATSNQGVSIHLDTLPVLRGRNEFIDARLIILPDRVDIRVPAIDIRNSTNAPSNVADVPYDKDSQFTIGYRWAMSVEMRPSIASAHLTVPNISCTLFTFSLLSDSTSKFSVWIVRS